MIKNLRKHVNQSLNCKLRLFSRKPPFPGLKCLTDEMNKTYVARMIERGKYDEWERKKLFESKTQTNKNFTMVLPPPNITGLLHLGHALTVAVEDVICRWHRMNGVNTTWIPGIDHAGIATQVVVEKKLWQHKKVLRHDLGRDLFVEEVNKWRMEKTGEIVGQIKDLGASLDWSKMFFTLDDHHSKAVNRAFVQLYNDGLIYRKRSLINWSCSLQSAISDIEVDEVEINGPTMINVPGYENPVKFGYLTKFAYKVCDTNEEIIVATTRPETMLGDVAVAVHPGDERYRHLHGRKLKHPFRSDVIPVILDDFVDRDFGTGAVKITPAHDREDFRVAEKHKLDTCRQVIDERGFIKFDNVLRRFDARERIVDALKMKGLFRGIEDHKMMLPICSRSKDVVECLLKPQWFVKMKDMADGAIDDVRAGRVRIDPKEFEQIWFQYLENCRDWCVSRQLWWGHRVPAYECTINGSNNGDKLWKIAETKDAALTLAAKEFNVPEALVSIRQDDDVLDTWFSSALLPFSSLGWPEWPGKELKLYPLSLMETGHDILFFWVARMLMLSKQLTNRRAFDEILLHGIICDSTGRKMSKSLGNVILPQDIINGISLSDLNEQIKASHESGLISKAEMKKALDGQRRLFPKGIPACGADALRFTLLSHNIRNLHINFDVDECHANALFCNKLWQLTKYARISCTIMQNYDADILPTRITSLNDNNDSANYAHIRNGASKFQTSPSDSTMDGARCDTDMEIDFAEKIARDFSRRIQQPARLTNKVMAASSSTSCVSLMDQWILSRLQHMLHCVNDAFQTKHLHQCTQALKNFLYYELCDVYVEYSKKPFHAIQNATINQNDDECLDEEVLRALDHCQMLSLCLDVSLRCLAPFMPFVTEELYKFVPCASFPDIHVASFPRELQICRNPALEDDMKMVLATVEMIRRLKTLFVVKKTTRVLLIPNAPDVYKTYLDIVETLTKSENIQIHNNSSVLNDENHVFATQTLDGHCQVYVWADKNTNSLRAKRVSDEAMKRMAVKEAKLTEKLAKIERKTRGSDALKKKYDEQIRRIKNELGKVREMKNEQ